MKPCMRLPPAISLPSRMWPLCNPACGCPNWHQPVASLVEDPVFDVWRRQWISSSFKATSPEHADIFVVNLRRLESQQDTVLYCAALPVVGSWLNPAHWMPRITTWIFKSFGCPRLTKVSFSVCNSALLGLAHVGSRLGLRARLSDAPELARALKPGSVFLAAGTRSTYELGPLPFGCDRLTVSKLCGQWKWQARPLSLSLC
jgi:hypothetical protein